VANSTFPAEDPRPAPKRDGQDWVASQDLDFIRAGLFAVQAFVGEKPGDRNKDMRGRNFASAAENFRAVSRMATGTLSADVDFINLIEAYYEDGTLYIIIAYGNAYWAAKKFYFLTDESGRLFTEAPLVFFQCTERNDQSGSTTASYDFAGTWKVTTSYFQLLPGSKSYISSWKSTDKKARFEWWAIQPVHGKADYVSDNSTQS
jgi:hypothetical protein